MESANEEKTPILANSTPKSAPNYNTASHLDPSKYQRAKKPKRSPVVIWVASIGTGFLVRVDKVRKGIFHIYEKTCIRFLLTTKQCAINPNLRIEHLDYISVTITKSDFHVLWPANINLPKYKKDITVYMQFYFSYYKEYHCDNLVEFLTRNKIIREHNKYFKTKEATITHLTPDFLVNITYVVCHSKNNTIVKTLSLNLSKEMNLTENTKLMFGEIVI